MKTASKYEEAKKSASAKHPSEGKKYDTLPPTGQKQETVSHMTSQQQLIEQQRIFNQLQLMFNKQSSQRNGII